MIPNLLTTTTTTALRISPAAALALAEEEGLTLERSYKNLSGYLYVNKHPGPSGRYQVW